MISARELRAIAASVGRDDYLRRTPGHREWLHFAIAGPEVEVVVNLSLTSDRARGDERVRLAVLVRRGGDWDGDVEDLDPARLTLRGPELCVRWGRNRIELAGDAFVIDARLTRRPIAVAVTIRPRTFPTIATNARISGGTLNWLVVPRSTASGAVAIGEVVVPFADALAYHDHNWGCFEHRALAWQWGYALPDDRRNAASLVFARLSDPQETVVDSQVLLLWDGARPSRAFRGAELEVEREGLLRPARMLVVPRVATAVASGPSDVPRRLHLRARADGDELCAVFEAEDVARIAIPNDADLGTTAIHEVAGRLRLSGRVRGAPVELDGRAMFELARRLT